MMKFRIKGDLFIALALAVVGLVEMTGLSTAGVNSVPQLGIVDMQGASYANTEGLKATYSAASQVVAASAATDVVYITGSAGKTTRITRINVGGRATSAAPADVSIVKRSTADTAGTCAAATAVPHDNLSASAATTIKFCTANPTLGTAVGTLREKQTFLGNLTTGAPGADAEFKQADRPSQTWVLRGAGDTIAINLNGGTFSGNLMDIDIEFTEE